MMRFDMDEIYRAVPLEEIPWNREVPPPALVDLLESGRVRPCKAIDLGCGAGNYSVYLAGRGFEATGVDASSTAIRYAIENAKRKGVSCRFIMADLLGDLHEIKGTFGFALEWALLHQFMPAAREKYVANVHRLLDTGGKYLSVCFSEDDPGFGGRGKYRKTQFGSTLYFSSPGELKALFEPFFRILETKVLDFKGKFEDHIMNYVFMEKR